MIIQSYTDCIHLFAWLAYSDVTVKDFFVGEDKRLLEASRSSIEYPFVWIEYADGNVLDAQANGIGYECRMFVVSHTTHDNPSAQEETLVQCEEIVKRMLFRLRTLSKTGKILFKIERSKWMRVRMAQLDNNWGWEIRLDVGSYLLSKCVQESNNVDARILTATCETVQNGSLDIVINGNSYSEAWDGNCEKLCGVLERIANQIDLPISASVFGNFLYLRSTDPNTQLNIDLNQGDFSWDVQLQDLFSL